MGIEMYLERTNLTLSIGMMVSEESNYEDCLAQSDIKHFQTPPFQVFQQRSHLLFHQYLACPHPYPCHILKDGASSSNRSETTKSSEIYFIIYNNLKLLYITLLEYKKISIFVLVIILSLVPPNSKPYTD